MNTYIFISTNSIKKKKTDKRQRDVAGCTVLTNPGGVFEPHTLEAALPAGVLVAVAQVAAVAVHRLFARHPVDLDADTRVGALL